MRLSSIRIHKIKEINQTRDMVPSNNAFSVKIAWDLLRIFNIKNSKMILFACNERNINKANLNCTAHSFSLLSKIRMIH